MTDRDILDDLIALGWKWACPVAFRKSWGVTDGRVTVRNVGNRWCVIIKSDGKPDLWLTVERGGFSSAMRATPPTPKTEPPPKPTDATTDADQASDSSRPPQS